MSAYLSNLLSRAFDPPRGLRPLSTSLATVFGAAAPASPIESLETPPRESPFGPIADGSNTFSTGTDLLNDLSQVQRHDNEKDTSLFPQTPHTHQVEPATASSRCTASPSPPLASPAPLLREETASANSASVTRANEVLVSRTPSIEQITFRSSPVATPRTPNPSAITEIGGRIFHPELPMPGVRTPHSPDRRQQQPNSSIQSLDPSHPESTSAAEDVDVGFPSNQTRSAVSIGDPATNATAVPQEISLPRRALRPEAIHTTHKPQQLASGELPSRSHEEQAEPIVHITIGRLEIRAATSAIPQRAEKPPSNGPSLDEYLRRRTRGRHE